MPSEPGYHTFISPLSLVVRVFSPKRGIARRAHARNIFFLSETYEVKRNFPSSRLFRVRYAWKMYQKSRRESSSIFPDSEWKGVGDFSLTNTIHFVHCKRLTRTNCPVLLIPVPFFIKIKKKFIRTHGGALEL